MMTAPYTFALLEVSAETWMEIATKLALAGYEHTMQDVADDDGKPREVIDMHGIGLVRAAGPIECTSAAEPLR
jgi:hypothetical protein